MFFPETRDNFLYIEQKFGGHLGFYEGGIICPNSVSWLDKLIVNLADALAIYTDSGKTQNPEDFESAEEDPEGDEELSSVPGTPELVVRRRPQGGKRALHQASPGRGRIRRASLGSALAAF